jgi:hypothetical protein
MSDVARDCLLKQFDIARRLLDYHLETLTTAECLWRPAHAGLHVRQVSEDRWVADWPEGEGYHIGPPSIAWLTWHILFWWSMVLDHSLDRATLRREEVGWPGDVERVRDGIDRFAQRWRSHVATLTDTDLASPERTRWPFQDRPFGDVVAWVNLELAKNAAEIGYARFLHGVAGPPPAAGG